jgi:adenosylcobinamide amidohydrolase/predicted amidohydrolase
LEFTKKNHFADAYEHINHLPLADIIHIFCNQQPSVFTHIRRVRTNTKPAKVKQMHKLFITLLLFVAASASSAAEIVIPANIQAEARVISSGRDGLWEKSLIVSFPEKRRTLSTFDGLVEAKAAMNHSAHPLLWQKVSKEFMNKNGCGGKVYVDHIQEEMARVLKLKKSDITKMATAADMDNLAVVTKEYGPLSVTVLATAGAKTNAIRTGVDVGTNIEVEEEHGTINIMVLTNAKLTDGAMARAIVTVTEGKTAALEDLKVPSTYTKNVQATGTGTDSVIIVSGTTGPQATYAGGHSRLGELIGKATYEAVVESLGKQNGFFLPGAKKFSGESSANSKAGGAIRIALLHLDAVPGDVSGNRARVESAIKEAVAHGADWFMTPELAETGYNFSRLIGTDWIAPFPDTWISTLAAIARDNRVALFIGFAERDGRTGKLHNSVAVIDRNGVIQGAYRKQLVHGSAESWSTAGTESTPFMVDGIPVGVLICADAYKPDFSALYRQQGAAILISPANWPPVGDMGPKGQWEARTKETGLPLVVDNRTGKEAEIDFSQGQSVVAAGGKRVFSFSSPVTQVFYVDWDGKQGFSDAAP